jgi:hypothetical protein
MAKTTKAKQKSAPRTTKKAAPARKPKTPPAAKRATAASKRVNAPVTRAAKSAPKARKAGPAKRTSAPAMRAPKPAPKAGKTAAKAATVAPKAGKAAPRAKAAPALAAAKPSTKAPAKPASQPAVKAAPAAKVARGVKSPVRPAKVELPLPLVATVDDAGLGWVDAGKGYTLTLDAGKLAARNDKGKRLSSVPKDLKDGDVADQLEALRDWLAEHDRECVAQVETWMLRSLPVPRAVLQAVWEDPSWRRPLENAVIVAVDEDGGHDHARAGLFRGVDPGKGVGIVDLDGETGWLDTHRVAIPHPILIPELDGWRELVTQLGVTQGIAQLHRETHPKPAELAAGGTVGGTAGGTTIDAFEDGKFAMLMHAIGKARALGYKVRGGFATCQVWDGGAVSEARYWIGADSPEAETYTGQLSWVDGRERGLALAQVGPVAFSEGMRMASAIYAARVVEKQEDAS